MRKLLHRFNFKLPFRNPNPRFVPNPRPAPLDQALSSPAAASSLAHGVRPLSRILSNTFISCHHGAHAGSPSSSLGFLAFRILSRKATTRSNAVNFAGLIENGVQLLKVSLRRRPLFNFGRFSGSGLSSWY